ncbi:hypothetical protein IMSHALPRED_005715 [Imshaugia aleurites]|uniref:Uncharacterized protein n=1 Tax=Imshaugia aleurites TaxID=172621 RepID=A0A8H3FDK8_9LECA|nr:hypothetical protein IMSHALPRED_005715 [Imshaugia aleurites]
MVISDYMAASRRSPLMRDQWRAGDDHRDSNRRRNRGTDERSEISPAAPRETDVGLKIKGIAAAESAPESPSEHKRSERDIALGIDRARGSSRSPPRRRPRDEEPVQHPRGSDHGIETIETREVWIIDGEEQEADLRNGKFLVLGRNGEGLAARFTPVALTPSAQAVGVANGLLHRHVQIEATVTRPLILTRVAPLAVSETRTFLGHDYVLGLLDQETGLRVQEGHLRNDYGQSGAHLLVVGLEKRVNLPHLATVLYPTLVVHQGDTENEAEIKTDHYHRPVGGQENRGRGEDPPKFP